MIKISDLIRLNILKAKAHIRNFFVSKPMQVVLSYDITFIFLFLSIKLLGYSWNATNLLGCIGLWVLIKELFKHVRGVASELRQK